GDHGLPAAPSGDGFPDLREQVLVVPAVDRDIVDSRQYVAGYPVADWADDWTPVDGVVNLAAGVVGEGDAEGLSSEGVALGVDADYVHRIPFVDTPAFRPGRKRSSRVAPGDRPVRRV